jgi:hypothetical protein
MIGGRDALAGKRDQAGRLSRPIAPHAAEGGFSSFWVTFRNHTLMNPEAITWLNQVARLPLNGRQRLALVYLW